MPDEKVTVSQETDALAVHEPVDTGVMTPCPEHAARTGRRTRADLQEMRDCAACIHTDTGQRCGECGEPWPCEANRPAPQPDPAVTYLAEAEQRWDTAENARWQDYPTALEHLGKALRSMGDVPLLLRAVRAVREIHRPFGIYDECGHEHTDQDVRDRIAVATHDFLTCHDGLLYEVCTECCTGRSAPFGQTEDCADEHDHGAGKPICPTSEAITGALTGKASTDG